MLDKDSKIYIAGHRGLVGSAVMANLRKRLARIYAGGAEEEEASHAAAESLAYNVLLNLKVAVYEIGTIGRVSKTATCCRQ